MSGDGDAGFFESENTDYRISELGDIEEEWDAVIGEMDWEIEEATSTADKDNVNAKKSLGNESLSDDCILHSISSNGKKKAAQMVKKKSK